MNMSVNSEYLGLLKNRVNLREIPFSEHGSREGEAHTALPGEGAT